MEIGMKNFFWNQYIFKIFPVLVILQRNLAIKVLYQEKPSSVLLLLFCCIIFNLINSIVCSFLFSNSLQYGSMELQGQLSISRWKEKSVLHINPPLDTIRSSVNLWCCLKLYQEKKYKSCWNDVFRVTYKG